MQWTSSTQQTFSPQAGLEQLPVMPHLLIDVLSACQKPSLCFNSLAALIQMEASLYLRVLSAAHTRSTISAVQLQSIEHLLASLGREKLRALVATSAVNSYFSPQEKPQRNAHEKYWQNAIRCGHAAKLLAEASHYPYPEEAYLAGLCHNLGQALCCTRHPKEYAEAFISADSTPELQLFEQEWFGQSSEQIGAEHLQDTLEGSFLVDAILFQNRPVEDLQDTPALVKIVNLAHRMFSLNGTPCDLSDVQLDEFNLTHEQVIDIQEQTESALSGLKRRLGMQTSINGAISLQEKSAQSRLGKQVRGFATLFALNQQPASTQLDLGWQHILDNINILFGLPNSAAFEYNEQTNSLIGTASLSGSLPQLKQLQFKVTKGRSVLSAALLKNALMESGDSRQNNTHALADQHLIRLLNAEAIVCVPLIDQDFRLGVVAIGLKHQQLRGLSLIKDELEQFAQTFATRLANQKEQQLQLQQALDTQRTAYLSEIRQLAHEAANPLGIINNYVQVICRHQDGDSKLSGQLQMIRDEIDRIASIVEQMKDIDAPAGMATGLININQLIRDQIKLFQESLFTPNLICCDLDLDNDLGLLNSHGQSLNQILTNLLRNAAEAMPKGGRVQISTRNSVNFNGSIYAELVIADTGSGIAPQVLTKAFTPVSSTKGSTHAGLGLSIVNTLVTNLNGYISCRNRNEGGAEFTILLPNQN